MRTVHPLCLPSHARFPTQPPAKHLRCRRRLVEPVGAEHDLDNLRLADLGEGVGSMEAVYELEALMLTGMVLDLASLAARLREQVCDVCVGRRCGDVRCSAVRCGAMWCSAMQCAVVDGRAAGWLQVGGEQTACGAPTHSAPTPNLSP